jgi:phosphoribosylglycinamide formyltransferase-1
MKKIVILISGRGSNLQAILSARLPVTVAAVISNEPAAGGLAIAKQHGVATRVVDHNAYADRAAFDAALAKEIDALKPDLVALAGFMRILTDDFVRHFAGRLINIHPSLLPAFTGLHTHRRALEAGVKVHGCTVHFVTPQLDHGPIVIQAAVPVLPGDSEDALATRVLEQEHRIYPQSIRWFCEDRLEITPRGTVKLKPARDTSGTPASREQGPAERGAGTRLRDATANPAVSASVIPAPCASPGSDPKGNPLPPCDAPRLRDAIGRESGAALSSAGVASVSGVTSPEGDPVPPSDGAPASREQGSRLRDATGRESGAALSSAGVASVSGVTSPKGAPVPPSDGAPASREQGSRLRDASVRESGAAPSNAGVASVSGVTSPEGDPVPPSDGALLSPALDP